MSSRADCKVLDPTAIGTAAEGGHLPINCYTSRQAADFQLGGSTHHVKRLFAQQLQEEMERQQHCRATTVCLRSSNTAGTGVSAALSCNASSSSTSGMLPVLADVSSAEDHTNV